MRTSTYFLSDLHLGMSSLSPAEQRDRERKAVRWLDSIKEDAAALYLLGDIFDYWYEYKYVVPRGFTRFLGKLAELSDLGVEIHWFIGNHDIWIFDYLPAELGAVVHREPAVMTLGGRTFYLAHGDGLGHTPFSFRFVRALFRNRFCQWLYAAIHPRWTVAFARGWSSHSRAHDDDAPYLGENEEFLVQYAKEYLRQNAQPHIDFFVFGHRHIMLDLMLSRDSRVVILGDWIRHFSYARFDGEHLTLEQFVEE